MTDFQRSVELLTEELALAALDYLDRFAPDFVSERGGVPLPILGVVGAALQNVDGWFWAISPDVAQRLGVPRKNEKGVLNAKLHAWAGLRVLNEAMIIATDRWPDLRSSFEGREYWKAVLGINALGPRAFAALAKYAGGPEFVYGLVHRGEAPNVGSLDSATVARRILTVELRVRAAERLNGRDIPPANGVIVTAPDARVRRKVAKVATIAQLGLHAYDIAVANDWVAPPKWFSVPPIAAR